MKRFDNVLLLLTLIVSLLPTNAAFALPSLPALPSADPNEPGTGDEMLENELYLPALARPQPSIAPNFPERLRVNVPFFDGDVIFNRAAIFWFGRVNSSENYADVRIGYNSAGLHIRVSIFDRLLWVDRDPTASDLLNWDAVSVRIDTQSIPAAGPSSTSYRFDAQLDGRSDANPTPPEFRAAFRGTGSSWSQVQANFDTTDGTAWESGSTGGVNNNQNNRGWLVSYTIPYSSLGVGGPPASGTVWRLAVGLFDKESQNGAVDVKGWPAATILDRPASWGELRFGLPEYIPPNLATAGSLTVREGLNGASVPDADVGGSTAMQCSGNPNYIWNQWGDATFSSIQDFNVQNQGNLGDWPCFAKYYVTFPLDDMPAGKRIKNAFVQFTHFGNSDPSAARASWIQVMTVAGDWSESSISWNNAPLALENVDIQKIDPIVPNNQGQWDSEFRTWDVSLAVSQAYLSGQSLRLAFYSADGALHSGKYFRSSEFFNASGDEIYRPTLVITWAD